MNKTDKCWSVEPKPPFAKTNFKILILSNGDSSFQKSVIDYRVRILHTHTHTHKRKRDGSTSNSGDFITCKPFVKGVEIGGDAFHT